MNLLKGLGIVGLSAGLLLVGQLLTVAAEGQVGGQGAGLRLTPVSDAALTAAMKNAQGRVKSIAGRELIVDVGGYNMTFIVDDNTDVLARGAGRATRNAGGGVPITDLVHSGDMVRVSYRELSGWARAFEIQVRARNTIAAR
jgi:hypothetical protein